jgi:hypothetical protein
MPTPGGSRARRASRADEAQGATEGHNPQDPPEAALHDDGNPAPKMMLATDTVTVTMDEVVPRDGSPAPKVMPEVNTSIVEGATAATSASDAAADGPVPLSGPAAGAPLSPPRMVVNNNAVKELEVSLGHRPVGAMGDVSLSNAMSTTHFALNQVHDVLHRERVDLDEECMCLSVWLSML